MQQITGSRELGELRFNQTKIGLKDAKANNLTREELEDLIRLK